MSNENGVRKWEPSKERATVSGSPQTQQTQSSTCRQKLPGDSTQQQRRFESQLTQSPTCRQKLSGDSTQQKERFESQLEVDKFIENNLNKCRIRDISDFFRMSAKVSKRNRKISFLKKHLPAIAIKLKELSTSDCYFKDISSIVYGLQFMTAKDLGVMDILSVMTTMASESIKNIRMIQSLQAQHISMMLYGLQRIDSR